MKLKNKTEVGEDQDDIRITTAPKVREEIKKYFIESIRKVISNKENQSVPNARNKMFIRECLGIKKFIQEQYAIRNKRTSSDPKAHISAWCESYVRFSNIYGGGSAMLSLQGFIDFVCIKTPYKKLMDLLSNQSLLKYAFITQQRSLLEKSKLGYIGHCYHSPAILTKIGFL